MSEAIATAPSAGLLDRDRSLAGPNFNRWLVPPAALAIHLCIGMGYGFSVFWLPMSRLLTNTDEASCKTLSWVAMLTSTTCNWNVPLVTHTFEFFIAFLGIAAALWGGWLEHAGPRKAGFIAALCWGGGMILGGIGVSLHQLWLLWVGTGIIGGVGMGLGYICPVSTLIKWFPDRRGMATGFAIMGYGGGAMIGSPMAVALMKHFGNGDAARGVAATMIAMGVIYFIAMSAGAFGMRVPPSGWRPTGWAPPADGKTKAMITQQHVHLDTAWKTPQFWLLWLVLCLNVTAGIGVLSMASPMFQDVFGARLIGLSGGTELTTAQKAAVVASAAGLVGLISLFNSLGRIFWASSSDYLGRKLTYCVYFIFGMVLYVSLPSFGHLGQAALFVIAVCLIISMYGGGFSTIPAYLADVFGTQMVGAIHGRLLTAWSVAGVVGPFLIAALRQAQLDAGSPKNLVYDHTLYILAGLLLVGLICNLLMRPVNPKYYMTPEQLAREKALQHEDRTAGNAESAARGSFGFAGVLAWLAIGIPFLIGVYIAFQKAAALF
jgi:MFS family permease